MTLAYLLATATDEFEPGTNYRELAEELAEGILDLFGEDAPCGFEEPSIENDRYVPPSFFVAVPETWAARVCPEDARAMARMLLHAADEADGEMEKIRIHEAMKADARALEERRHGRGYRTNADGKVVRIDS